MEPARLCAIEKELPVGWGSSVWAEGFPTVPKALGLISSSAIRKGGRAKEDGRVDGGESSLEEEEEETEKDEGVEKKGGRKDRGNGGERRGERAKARQ